MEVLGQTATGIEGNELSTGSQSSLHLVRRALLFRDSLTFLVLTAATLILYAATSFLFRSFEERRGDLARDFTARGRMAMSANQPDQAIAAFRTALSYAPDDRMNHLLLAEALAQAHHTEEATNYFLNLREAQPADGFINFELARLAREKGDRSAAIEYYRASSLGSWTGDSVNLRRTVQVELADYLVKGGDLPAARAELLLAAANTPETASLDTLFGDKLLEAQDPADSLTFYRKAVHLEPHDATALSKAGHLLYATGMFAEAHDALERALAQEPKGPQGRAEVAQDKALAEDAERIQQLTLSANLSPAALAEHIRTDVTIVRARLKACAAKYSAGGVQPPELGTLISEWQAAGKVPDRRSAVESATDQANLKQLIFNTEIETSRTCGTPTGDDALLLQLAQAYVAP